MDLQLTSLEQLKKIAEGELIPLPRFTDDIPFVVRAKRVSLLNLIQKGVIPNTLLSAAEELFYGKQASKAVNMDELTNVMSIMAKSCLMEPSVEQLEEIGLELTDQQLVALFNYSQEGLKAIEKFRPKSENTVNNNNEQEVPSEAEPTAESN
jgi:hypothetical protein